MTGLEVYNEVVELVNSDFFMEIEKLHLIRNLLPSVDEDEEPVFIKDMQETLKSSGEKGLAEILDDALDGVGKFLMMLEFLSIKILREEKEKALTTEIMSDGSEGLSDQDEPEQEQ